MVKASSVKIAPPIWSAGARPPDSVMPLSDTLPILPSMLTKKSRLPATLLAVIVKLLAPGPTIDTSCEMVGNTVASVIVRGVLKKVASKSIVSATAVALADVSAARKLPAPASLLLRTVKTAGATRLSKVSNRGRTRYDDDVRVRFLLCGAMIQSFLAGVKLWLLSYE